MRPSASARCGRRSNGATTFSMLRSSASFAASPSSPAASRSKQPRRSVKPTWRHWIRYSKRVSSQMGEWTASDARDDSRVRARAPRRIGRDRTAPGASLRVPAGSRPHQLGGQGCHCASARRDSAKSSPNYRASLAWALEADPRRCLELAVSLGRFWVIRDHAEGDRWLTDALNATTHAPPELRAEALLWAGSCRFLSWDYAPAAAMVEESLALFRDLGDLNRVADALDRLSGAQFMLGNREDARASAEESLALCEELGNRRQMMYALGKVGSFAREDGDDRASPGDLRTGPSARA